MESVGDGPASGFADLGRSNGFGRHWFDAAAVALLALGCVTGTVMLILQGTTGRPAASAEQQVLLQQRVRELEQRLLEQVSPAIEQQYRDY
jgi:hypothetical protein